jgi:Zinc finger, C2H2 type
MSTLSKELKCLICNQTFNTKQGLEHHEKMQICVKRKDRYKCEICNHDFKKKSNYEKHKGRTKKCEPNEKEEENGEENEEENEEILEEEIIEENKEKTEDKKILELENKKILEKIKELELENKNLLDKIRVLEERESIKKISIFETYEKGVIDVIFGENIHPKNILKEIEIIIDEKTKKKTIEKYKEKLKNRENIIYKMIEEVFCPRGWIEMIDEREILEKYIKFYLKIKTIFNEEQNKVLTTKMKIAKDSYES